MSFSATRMIEHKRDGDEISDEDLKSFVTGVVSGQIPEYQISAFLMATYFKGMSSRETVTLTRAMKESGETYDFSNIPGPKSDKHSTGGVGDKISLILAPLATACGLKVPMMSGRGLGHSGGTLDKLESIPGFQVRLPKQKVHEALSQVGCAMIGQSEAIVPADRKLYSLRDVTGTVECIPLIVASILSKKLAEGTQSLVMDVKVGNGAFMKTMPQARKLAQTIIKVAKGLGLPCRALITDMSQPLGYAVGNQLELIESIEVLRGKKYFNCDTGSSDIRELTLQLVAHMLELSKLVKTLAEGRKLAIQRLNDGSAWEAFKKIVAQQGGQVSSIENLESLPQAPYSEDWNTSKKGYLNEMDTTEIGRIVSDLGGGRKKATDMIDPTVGLVFHKKLGSRVYSGDLIATVYARSPSGLSELKDRFESALTVGSTRKAVPKLILKTESA